MENKAPDILAELCEIETKDGQPWEPEPFGKFSAVLSVASRKFAAHVMLESNLVSGMTAAIPIKFDDFPMASELFGEGAEFTVADRGFRCRGTVVKVYAHPESTARHADGGMEIGAPSPVVHAGNGDASAAPENWAPPKELAGPVPRRCGPTSTYYAWQIYFILSGVALVVIFGLLFGFPVAKLHAEKMIQERGVAVDATVISSVAYAGRASTRGSTPSHFSIDYSYEVVGNTQGGTKENVYRGGGRWKRSGHSAEQVAPGAKVPVFYDPAEPGRSMLVDDLDLADYGAFRVFGIIAIALSIGCPAFFAWAVYRSCQEGQRLLTWGQVARASLLDKKPVGKKENTWRATYAFRDHRGALVKFSQYKTADETGQLDEQQVVVFDPKDSSKAMGYPLKFAELQTSGP